MWLNGWNQSTFIVSNNENGLSVRTIFRPNPTIHQIFSVRNSSSPVIRLLNKFGKLVRLIEPLFTFLRPPIRPCTTWIALLCACCPWPVSPVSSDSRRSSGVARHGSHPPTKWTDKLTKDTWLSTSRLCVSVSVIGVIIRSFKCEEFLGLSISRRSSGSPLFSHYSNGFMKMTSC